MYWTAASWGSAISLGADQPELVADLPAVRALLLRALALDEDYDDGAIHAALIAVEGAPPMMGGSPRRAREHFRRAVELSRGELAGPYVTLAVSVAVPTQDRAELERLLRQALAIDPDAVPARRVQNLVAQRHARALLDRADELFGDSSGAEE
jgi:predicted anti-sigma-YlaC factor YlaD